MTKRRLSKLVITLVCAVLVLPFVFNTFSAKADEIDKTVYQGVDFTLDVTEDAVKEAGTSVSITIKDGDKEAVEIYRGGTPQRENFKKANAVFESYSNSVMKLRIGRESTAEYYVITVATIADATKAQSFNVKVVNEGIKDIITAPKYKFDETKTVAENYASYIEKAQQAAYKDGKPLFIGDKYKVPSIENEIETGYFNFSELKKTLYYAAPGSSSYTSYSGSNLEFSVTKVGEYKFYFTFSIDEIDGETFNLNTKDTVEYADGFYKVKTTDGEELIVEGTTYYYLDNNEEKVEYDGELVKGELVIPVFEFTVEPSAPQIKIKNAYQENGYIGLEYTVKGIEVTGSDVNTTYTLQYKETLDGAWATATEEYNGSTGKFTPEKQGYYRVKVVATDAYGLDAGVKEEIATAVITVTEKLQKVEYQTSFKNWLSVNKTPFIFLCVSAGCLVLILVLIFVPTRAFEALGGKVKSIFKKREKEVKDDDSDEE